MHFLEQIALTIGVSFVSTGQAADDRRAGRAGFRIQRILSFAIGRSPATSI